jgi:hypothetical protein
VGAVSAYGLNPSPRMMRYNLDPDVTKELAFCY